MKKKIISVVIMFLMIFVSAAAAQSVNVKCESKTEPKSEVAQINITKDETAPLLSESDIIFYIKDSAEKYKADGIKRIVLNLDSGVVNEDNIANIVNEIDVINVLGSGDAHVTKDTIITYSDAANDSKENENSQGSAENNSDNKKSSENKLNSIIYTTLTLLAIALIALFAAKKAKKK